ncbi:MAG: hypothetical protein L6408_09450 [Nanoarchaeota archaeon]|nr:hypothetical protein [Nanoarchaeota archaeon]
MKRYSGFKEDGYRFEVQVPTTIFDNKFAVIQAYQDQKLVDEIHFKLKKMPEWNVPCQCILLGKSDEKTLEKKTEELIRRLK